MKVDVDVVILMGVSGCGKTTVGRGVAGRWGAAFFDADDFHPRANVAKMARGEPLDDVDRWPWLERLRVEVLGREAERTVLACSGLKAAHRARLTDGVDAGRVLWVYLRGDLETIRKRMDARDGHYMKSGLLESQFEALEEPEGVMVVGIEPPVESLVDAVVAVL